MEENSLVNLSLETRGEREGDFAGTFIIRRKKSENSFMLSKYDNCGMSIKNNLVMRASFFENGRAYVCTVVSDGDFDPHSSDMLSIRTISPVTEAVRRVHCRHSCHLALQYAESEDGEVRNAFINDISAGGISVISEELFPYKKELSLSFEIPSESGIHFNVKVKGTVVSARSLSDKNGTYNLHIRFDNADYDTSEAIVRYVFAMIRQK